jgi:hypothetical protein
MIGHHSLVSNPTGYGIPALYGDASGLYPVGCEGSLLCNVRWIVICQDGY